MPQEIQLMDVTVREGSYCIEHQWSLRLVAQIATLLEDAKISYMEVGNGGGLGVSDDYYRDKKPQSTDVEQLRAAKQATQKLKIGLLALPEPITQKKHIEIVKAELDFLRIAARVDDMSAAKSNVEYAKSLNIPVFFQIMRSSKAPLKSLIEAAKQAQAFGADGVYVVDTNGHFLPAQVSQIITALKENLQVPIGFHPHNHLMLATANCLAAAQAGASFLDGSLLGFGRDAGNAQLETLVAVLQQIKKAEAIDLKKLFRASKLVAPIMPQMQGVNPVYIAQGKANVCLYPLETYFHIAQAAGVDFFDFIERLGQDSKSEPDVKEALRKMGKDPEEIFKKLGIA